MRRRRGHCNMSGGKAWSALALRPFGRLDGARTMTEPRCIRLSPEDNVVVAVDQIGPGISAAGVTARERVPRGHKMAVAPIARRRAGAQIRPDHRLCVEATIAPGDWVHEHNVGLHDFARDYRFAEDARNDEMLPPEPRATFEGYVRAERQDRHAQLYRHPHLGELLGLGREVHRRGGQPLGHARRLSRDRRRGAVRARHRLRHGGLRRRLRRAAPHAMGLCHPSQSGRRR